MVQYETDKSIFGLYEPDGIQTKSGTSLKKEVQEFVRTSLPQAKVHPRLKVSEVVFHLLFLFRNIDQNSEVLCHSLDYRVAGNLIVENHRYPTA